MTTGFINATINNIKVNSSIPCNKGNFTVVSDRTIKYIVMHYTGNKKDTAIANAKYFNSNSNCQASAHFFVDDTSIYQSVALVNRAWHCGTSGTYYHAACRNNNSIGIEMCCTAGNYTISETTKNNSAYLCAYLCNLIGITSETVDTYVLRHYDITHKSCPNQMVKNNSEWVAFKNKVKEILKPQIKKEEDEDMTLAQFTTLMDQYLAEQAKKDFGAFSADAREWNKKSNILRGNASGSMMPKKFITREETLVLMERLAKFLKEQ